MFMRKKKKKGKRHKRTIKKRGRSPLSSRRFCLRCDRMTRFYYNRKVRHSECTICGWRFTGGDVV